MADKNKKQDNKGRAARGSYPPKLNLAEAGEIVTALYERTGSGASLDQLSEILGNSLKSSSFVTKLNALKRYDLITLDDKGVKLSDVGEAIVAPKDLSERAVGLKTAFLQLESFQTVYEKYKGRLLPEDGFLKNSFLEVGGKEMAGQWMDSFKASAQFAGLLMDRGDGKLQVRETGKAPTKAADDETVNGGDKNNGRDDPKKDSPPPMLVQTKSDYQFLIEIMNADMSQPEMDAVWTLLQYLKKKESQ